MKGSLRLGIDLDGTLADFSSVYHAYQAKLFGDDEDDAANERVDGDDENDEDAERDAALASARERARRRDAIWRALRATPNLWKTLQPIEPGVIARLHELASRHRWEVYFLTQRPASAGDSVQQQTQQWLAAQGYPLPSVLTLTGGRGRAAAALELDFLIDDLPKNCVDCMSDSQCQPILLLREQDKVAESAARRMRIGVARSMSEALDLVSHGAGKPRETVVAGILRRLRLRA